MRGQAAVAAPPSHHQGSLRSAKYVMTPTPMNTGSQSGSRVRSRSSRSAHQGRSAVHTSPDAAMAWFIVQPPSTITHRPRLYTPEGSC